MDKPEQLAAELWPMAQLGRDEGIQDAINRMAPTIQRAFEERERVLRERPQFPILGGRGAKIDLQLVQDHGKQAQSNHYQTVTRLAERGGLSWCELHAVLHSRPWQKMDENTAIVECRALEARYLASLKDKPC